MTKSYARRRLFDGLTGAVGPGCGIVVTGDNGSGKSTFLKILAGLTRPDSGEVRRPSERNAIGYAAPHMALYGELTGLENARFYRAARGLDEDDFGLRDLLTRLGLGRAADKLSGSYSTGMTQRLRLACALGHRPGILLFDEPTIGLDLRGTIRVEEVVWEHVAAGSGAALVTTNDPAQCRRFEQAGWGIVALGA